MKQFLNPRMQQQGMSMWEMMFILVVIGFVATAAVKMGPAYMDNNVVKDALVAVQQSFSGANIQEVSDGEIKSKIGKYFDVNMVNDVIIASVKVTRDKQKVILSVNYEIRQNFISNVDVVMVFNNEVDLAK
jgi:hypothetical protein